MQQRYLILQSTIRTGSGCSRIASSIITSREVKVTEEVINAMEENLLLRSKKIVLSLAKNFSKGIYDAFAN